MYSPATRGASRERRGKVAPTRSRWTRGDLARWILGFYGIALLWIPFVLPLWYEMPLVARLAVPPVLAGLQYALYHHFGFWGSETLQALVVEHESHYTESHYTWGQLARAPLVLFGLLIGGQVLAWHSWTDCAGPRVARASAAPTPSGSPPGVGVRGRCSHWHARPRSAEGTTLQLSGLARAS